MRMRWKLIAWWQSAQSSRAVWLRCLLPVSFVYGIAQSLHRLYKEAISKQAPLRIISIGSPRAGGSGKTPLTRALMQWLNQHAHPVVITRGYGVDAQDPIWVRPGCAGASEVGDEPWMLSGMATGRDPLHVIVAKRRREGCELAVRLGFDLAVLDDGMQHYELKRDLSIGIISVEDFDSALLPVGKLREPLHSLQRCDWIFVRQHYLLDEFQKTILARWKKPWLSFDLISPSLHQAPRGEIISWSQLKGVRVIAFAAIANPQALFDQLQFHGLDVIASWPLADHQPINENDLVSWINLHEKSGAKAVICSEKDWARLDPLILKLLPMPLLWPSWQVSWEEGSEVFFKFLETWLKKDRPIGHLDQG